MISYDLYGAHSSAIFDAKGLLEALLQIRFVSHDSGYQGGLYYRCGNSADEHFILKQNIDPFENEPAELKFAEYPVLFYVNCTSRSAELAQLITSTPEGFVLLRHEDFIR